VAHKGHVELGGLVVACLARATRRVQTGDGAQTTNGIMNVAVTGKRKKIDAHTDECAIVARKYTITDIAQLANVSRKTVSRVLNDSHLVHQSTRTRIAEIIEQVGYASDAKILTPTIRRSFLIGLVYDNSNASHVVNIQEGVLSALRRFSFELVVHPIDLDSKDFLTDVKRFVIRQKLDGIIVLPPVSENATLAEMLTTIRCPYVRIGPIPFDEEDCLVVSMDRASMSQIAEHLTKLGHKRIGMISGPSTHRSSQERINGFRDSLRVRERELFPDMLVAGDYTFESGAACAELLLSRTPRPTAIFAANDEIAAGVYRTAFLHGLKIPSDITVIGFDDSPLAPKLCPALTTMHQPARAMGRSAAEKLVAKISKASAPSTEATAFFPHLIVRESSCRPKLDEV